MMVYRGFACAEEALNVLMYHTVGGEYGSLSIEFSDTIQNIVLKQKTTGGEGLPIKIMQKSTKNRQGVIEYTTNFDQAFRFGPLCVIGGIVKDSEKISIEETSPDPESGVFFYTNTPIDIQGFCFGYFFHGYPFEENSEMKKYKPPFPNKLELTLTAKDIKVMKGFVDSFGSLVHEIR